MKILEHLRKWLEHTVPTVTPEHSVQLHGIGSVSDEGPSDPIPSIQGKGMLISTEGGDFYRDNTDEWVQSPIVMTIVVDPNYTNSEFIDELDNLPDGDPVLVNITMRKS